MSQSVVITITNHAYMRQTKQLFSSLFHHARWRGDCVVLAYQLEPEDIRWLNERGIVTVECSPLHHRNTGRYSPIVVSKLHIYRQFIKQWDHVIYLDSDIMVRGSLDELLEVSGFAAVADVGDKPIWSQFDPHPSGLKNLLRLWSLKARYDFSALSFNAGFFTFSTDYVDENTFSDFQDLIRRYADISLFADQGLQNIYYYQNWTKLPRRFNVFPAYEREINNRTPGELDGVIFHFADEGAENKPWHPDNYFHQEWYENLLRANEITFSDTPLRGV